MEVNNLENNNEIKLDNNLENNLQQENEQKSFLETTLGKTINGAVDIGIRALLPDFTDEQVINIKDNLLEYGLKDGITKTIDDAINLGKSAIGIFTGDFENISQMQSAVETGGLIDGISTLLDTVVGKANQAGVIDGNIANIITQGKDVILNNVESNIENTFNKQYENLENMDKYISNWKESFEKQDFNSMEKEYEKLEEQLKEIAPITKTIEEAKTIELLHNLIKNNGQDFNLSQEQLELVEKLK